MSIPFTVERSTKINAPAEAVYRYIADFQNWPKWSPWLSQEPDCPVTITGTAEEVGHKQEWDGKKIGSGSIQLALTDEFKKLEYDLHFLKPWKSQSVAGFTIDESTAGTLVSWYMQGTLPTMMFFMKKKMANMVGADYEKGLTMLKEALEN